VFHGVRNRFWVVAKDTPWPLLPLVVPLHLAAVVYIALRKANRDQLATVWRAFLAACLGLPQVLRTRAGVQRARRASALDIARAMTWDPRDLTGRRPVVRPIRPSSRSAGA
jgi:hypothetical protein